MNIETVPIESISPDPANVMTHPERNLETIKSSLRRFGQQHPIVVDADGIIRAGNGRHAAAKALGWTEINIVRTNLKGSEATAFSVADNRTAELAEWNDDGLYAILKAMEAEGIPHIDVGFTVDEFKALEPETVGLTDPDEVPAPPTAPKTKPGDLWIMGEHRLLCGDSTDPDQVARLMNGEKAGLMNTDPPYGVVYANDDRPNPGVAKPRVANDDLNDERLQAFLESAFRPAKDLALKNNAAWYLWHAHLTQGYFAAAAAAADVILHRQIIWIKPVLLLGRGQYHWKHEPCFMGWVRGNRPPDYGIGGGERNQTTVWVVGSIAHAERKEFNHSTPKPVGIFTIPIVKHLIAGEIAYDPFIGTGPQVVAAEQLNRRCFGMELEPSYVEVAVNRWEKFTGKTAKLETNL